MLRQTQQAAKISAAQVSSFKEWRIIVVVPLLVLSFLSAGLFVRIPTALAYSCNSHCYGLQIWDGNVNGAQTQVTIANLSCTGSCASGGFIDDEMWLLDYHTKACHLDAFFSCWVEAGYSNDGAGTYHFWADVRPIDGKYHLHPLMQASSYPTVYTLEGVCCQQFEVGLIFLYPCRYGCRYTYFSTQNSMSPDDIQIGQELLGTGGASASRADFSNNYWQGSINGGWNLQGYGNGPGVSDPNPPPYAAWVNPPYTSNDFYTYCC